MEVSQWIVIEYFTHHRFECGLKTALNDMGCVPWYLPKPQGHAPPCRSDTFHFMIALVKSQNNVNVLHFCGWSLPLFFLFKLPVSVETIFQKINTTLAYLRSLKKLGLFRKKLAEKMNSLCSHCLPDCQVEIVGDFGDVEIDWFSKQHSTFWQDSSYAYTVTSAPFADCDSRNLNNNPLCRWLHFSTKQRRVNRLA